MQGIWRSQYAPTIVRVRPCRQLELAVHAIVSGAQSTDTERLGVVIMRIHFVRVCIDRQDEVALRAIVLEQVPEQNGEYALCANINLGPTRSLVRGGAELGVLPTLRMSLRKVSLASFESGIIDSLSRPLAKCSSRASLSKLT